MSKLSTPKLNTTKQDIVKKFQDVCVGLTIVSVYAIVWMLIAALWYRIFLWVF